MNPDRPTNPETTAMRFSSSDGSLNSETPDSMTKEKSVGENEELKISGKPSDSPDLNRRTSFTELEKEQLIKKVISRRPISRSFIEGRLGKNYPTIIDELTDEIVDKAWKGIRNDKLNEKKGDW